jgi:hypothetical protein
MLMNARANTHESAGAGGAGIAGTWLPKISAMAVLFAYTANAWEQNWMTAALMVMMTATLTRKELIMVAPTRMGYRLITRKLRPSMKLPLIATTARGGQSTWVNGTSKTEHAMYP